MALKLKKLRESKNIKKQHLADVLGVTYRTVTNWEKENGVIPSLKTMKDIAAVMEIPTYDIFQCFMYGPDNISDKDFKFNDHSKDIPESFKKPSHSYKLFMYLQNSRLTASGIVIYKYRLFRYKTINIHSLLGNEEIDSLIQQKKPLYDCAVAVDENENSIVLSRENISKWHIISYEVKDSRPVHTVFEIEMTSAIFPEMEDELQQNGKCSVYLDAYSLPEEASPFTEPRPLAVQDYTDNVIGSYIREHRERKGIAQIQLARDLQEFGFNTTSGTINRMERGNLLPSAELLCILCVYLNIDIEKLLEAYDHDYYVSNAADSIDRCYDIGLHHSFWSVADYDSLKCFLNDYTLFNLAVNDIPFLTGHWKSDNIEGNISSFEISEQVLTIRLKAGENIEISPSDLQELHPVSLNMSVFYEFKGIIENKPFSLLLAYNIPKNIGEKEP